MWEAFHVAIASRRALLCAVLLVTGCAIPMVPYRAVYEDPVNYVRLEVDDSVLPEWPPSAHAASESDACRGRCSHPRRHLGQRSIGSGYRDGCRARRR